MPAPLLTLVVDDSAMMRSLLIDAVRQSGLAEFDFTEASDGIDALTHFDPDRTDLILTDWNMPSMNGIELVRTIRGLPMERHVPIVMVTTERSDEKVDEALNQAGADGIVFKPFTTEQVATMLTQVLGRYGELPAPNGTAAPERSGASPRNGQARETAAPGAPRATLSEEAEQTLRRGLDDAAALLMQLEPTDLEGLRVLRSALADLAAMDGLPAICHGPLDQAVRVLDDSVLDAAPASVDPARAAEGLAAAGRLIEAVTLALGDPFEPRQPLSDQPEVTGAAAVQGAETSAPAPASVAVITAPAAPAPSPAPTTAAPGAASVTVPTAAAPAAAANDAVATEGPGSLFELPAGVNRELMAEFVSEAEEHIGGAEAALLALESNPDDKEAVATVFRAFHTLKGTAGFMNLTSIQSLAHLAESLLSRMRDGEIRCTGGYADLALRATDMLKELVGCVRQALAGEVVEFPAGYADTMRQLADPHSAAPEVHLDTPALPRVGDILVATSAADREAVEAAAANKGDELIGVALLKSRAASAMDIVRALRTQRRLVTAEHSGPAAAPDSGVRVRTDRLDQLADMTGELVIAHAMASRENAVKADRDASLARTVNHIGKIARGLQELSLSVRMVPVKATYQKMARLVRDLAQKTGKPVELVTEGEDTEIDRNMVELLNDPLVHLIRNAVDHGIELPDEREASGKARSGVVRLSAHQSGDSIVVTLEDDGRGLERERILRKAIAKGLLDPSSADGTLPDSQIYSLIFAPGFSTADQVSDLSGRGVGLDVVKRHVELLRGRIDITSEPGKGATFVLRLPLTLAVTDGMVAQVGQEQYVFPTSSIITSFRPQPSALVTAGGRGELVMLRNELLPIVRLHRQFSVAGACEDPTDALLVVTAVQSNGDLSGKSDHRQAILVDELVGQQQVVAKPLGGYLDRIEGVSGAAVLGDGRIGLILEPDELAAIARRDVSAEYRPGRDRGDGDPEAAQRAGWAAERSSAPVDEAGLAGRRAAARSGGKFLTFFLSNEEYGIEILKVQEIIALAPLTRVPRTPVFICGVINVRGKVVPVVDLRQKLGMPAAGADQGTAARPARRRRRAAVACIVIVQTRGLEVGLVVDRVSDVLTLAPEQVEDPPAMASGFDVNNLLGVGAVGSRICLLLDVDQVLADPETAEPGASGSEPLSALAATL